MNRSWNTFGEKGEEIRTKRWRDGGLSFTIQQPGVGHVTAHLSEEQGRELAAFLNADKREPTFAAPAQEFNPCPDPTLSSIS